MFTDLLIQLALIERRDATTIDDYGNDSEDWKTIESAQPCRVSASVTPRVNNSIGSTQASALRMTVFMDPDAPVKQFDRLTVDGERMRVILVLDPSGAKHHLEVIVEAVRG